MTIADLASFASEIFRKSGGVLVGIALVAVFLLCYLFSTIRYCSPCGRKRGRFKTLCPECGKRMQTVYRKCS